MEPTCAPALRNQHRAFHFHTLDDLRREISDLGLELPVAEDPRLLLEDADLSPRGPRLSNRIVVLPMEGCDGRADGAPDELTWRRYRRFAAGGAGVLWFEATAVAAEGRANPRQLWLHEPVRAEFARLIEEIHRVARNHHGEPHRPLLVVQLTHSGRYSRPGRKPQPIIAHHSAFLDATHRLPADYPLISDDELERLEDAYVEAARQARAAGFDAVDIKACHRYLVSELLASHTRASSRYGGSWENRSRFFRNVVRKIRSAVPGILVTARMNAYDAMAYPYGFGVDRENPSQPDLTEPKELVGFLAEHGAPLVNITIGNPYYNPHVNRPFDLPTSGAPMPEEHPLVGVDRFVRIVREIQQAHPAMAVIGGGYSWLRHFFPHVAAGVLQRGWTTLAGGGRMAFAHPDFPRALASAGHLDPQKACVACSACTQIMRDGGRTGCVPRDPDPYERIYREGRAEALDSILEMARSCRQCNDPTCIGRCPARVNIPVFVGHIAERRFREAYETIRQANALAAVCGYVCPAEVLCESTCINNHYTASVPIRHLQRWVSRMAVEEGWVAEPRTQPAASPWRVAVIGAGPAGLAAAVHLASLGHRTVMIDSSVERGGSVDTVVPAERIPDAILRREIQDLLRSCGDRISGRQGRLGKGLTLDDLNKEGFSAVVLAFGLSESVPLPGARRPQSGVVGALEFLAQCKRGGRCQGTALVLGGGNTAIDAALAAKRAGANAVAIVYRRSYAEMPAWPLEREQAIQEGVSLLTLTAPLDYEIGGDGALKGLRVIRTQLGPADSSGRRRPVPIPGTEHVLPADQVIEAIGQRLDSGLLPGLPGLRLTESGLVWTQPNSLQTSRAGVYAAGDLVNGGTTVVQAVAEGARAAREVDRFLRSA
ncbi:MAG TPA: FAD-dependent oxidoreductase [Candidatus Paceibacterota bacterium]|nr:FAD-dependent oxidoreductase [Verrucomicrobiota bacterium]HOX01958.1 FAD-dependent oxidoreductase [Verrucomicrobiota bacterium]HRZ43999.1 FAD-dependent oxidoreductase [Candidatus Paceibacterota bacterium]HRZ93114.1 FAD-dependent oxidoreductase [Candidatus Paceibacterota bacterium]